MARYFFHLHDRDGLVEDDEGRILSGASSIAAAALREARCIIGHDVGEGFVRLGQRIDVEDEAHRRVYTLAFTDAVTIER